MIHMISIMFSASEPQNILYNQGILGVGIVAFSVALYKMFNIILKDRDKAVEQRDVLLEKVFTDVLPAIIKNTEVLQDRQELDKEIILIIRDATAAGKENVRVLEDIKYLLRPSRGNAETGGT